MRTGAALLTALAALACAACALAAAPAYSPPRTPWGTASFEGTWTNLSATHLERPAALPTLEVSEAQAAAYYRRAAEEAKAPAPAGDVGQGASEWREGSRLAQIDGHARSSWIVSPADGKLPYRPEALAARKAAGAGVLDAPETLTASDRCLAPGFSAAGPPMLNSAYAANYQILERPDEVVIVAEVLHEVRTIRIGGKPLPRGIRLWMGDSIGRWEGDTLVVETTGFTPAEVYRAPLYLMSPEAKVTERFTRISPTEIRYAFTVDDPSTFTQPWSGEEPFLATNAPIYEYACAEGNYALAGMLAGARREEAQAARGVKNP